MKEIMDIMRAMQEIFDIINWLPLNEPLMYIKSPTGNTIIRTDIKTARRIIRKHGWEHVCLPDVSRSEALRIFLLGNKIRHVKTLWYSNLRKTMKLGGN